MNLIRFQYFENTRNDKLWDEVEVRTKRPLGAKLYHYLKEKVEVFVEAERK